MIYLSTKYYFDECSAEMIHASACISRYSYETVILRSYYGVILRYI